MTIKVFVEDSNLAKQIDEIIYKLLDGLFSSYESHHGETDDEPTVSVKIILRSEMEDMDKFKYALSIYYGIKNIAEKECPQINIDDAFIEKGEI